MYEAPYYDLSLFLQIAMPHLIYREHLEDSPQSKRVWGQQAAIIYLDCISLTNKNIMKSVRKKEEM